MTKHLLKAECIRFRVEDRLSLTEIQRITGASKGILSLWLRPYPLTDEELVKRRRNASKHLTPLSQARAAERGPKLDRKGSVIRYGKQLSLSDIGTLEKGRIAEAATSLRLAVHGFSVYRSVSDGNRVDLVILDSATMKFSTLQVKWAGSPPSSPGRPIVPLRRKLGCRSAVRHSRRYDKNDFDFIIGYDFEHDAAYVFSQHDVENNISAVSVSDIYRERWDKIHDFFKPEAASTKAA